MNIQDIKAFLFDVDGLLIDSEAVFNKCWCDAARSYGYSLTREQALDLRSLDAVLAKKLFAKWFGADEVYALIRSQRKKIMTEWLMTNSIKSKPYASFVLNELQKKGFTVAVVTSSPKSRCTEYLKNAGIDNFRGEIITTEQVERGKPYPDVYRFACKKLGLNPSCCVAVEDSPNGLRSAHDAGLKTIMIPDLSPYSDDLKLYVDIRLQSLIEIIKL